MTSKTRLLGSCVVAASLSLGLLAGCSSLGLTGGVAATVNGTDIAENTITEYIEDMRESNDLEDDESWASYLSTYGMTAEDIRSDVIDYYVQLELESQAAEEEGIEVTDDEVDEVVESTKSNYDTDEEWESALENAGLTEDAYRENIYNSLLENKLSEKVTEGQIEPTDKEVLKSIKSYKSYFDGMKKSSHILFSSDDEETAQEVLDQINSGEIAFEEAAEQYSTDSGSASDGGNVGWDALNSFVDEYTEALDELDEGEVSALVTSDYGIHIIMCTDVWDAPKKIKSLDSVPKALVNYMTSYLESENESTVFSEWYDEYLSEQDVTINDMPDGLSYDVAEEEDEESSDDGSDDSSDDSSDSSDSSSDDSSSEE